MTHNKLYVILYGAKLGFTRSFVMLRHVEISVETQRHRMAISKTSEAVCSHRIDSEGATAAEVLAQQTDIETLINGSFFYFHKMEATYHCSPPVGKRVGDGVARCSIREYKTTDQTDHDRFGYVVQTRRGEPWTLQLDPPSQDAKYVLSCSPVLVWQNTILPNPTDTTDEKHKPKGPPGHLGHLNVPNPRSMIGQRRDGTLVLVSTSHGLVYEDMGRVMQDDMECVCAMALDGGGSTCLWHDGQFLIQHDPTRVIGNAIVVFKPAKG